jgi:hypothetical protein
MQLRSFTFRATTAASTKIDEPAQRHYGVTTKLLSYFSGASCGLSLLAISMFLTGAVGKVSSKLLFDPVFNPVYDLYGILGTLIAVGIGGLFVLGLGIASGRFLLRALPPTIWDQGGRGWFWSVVFYIAFIGVYICGTLAVLAMDTDSQPVVFAPVFAMEPKILLVGVLYIIVWTVGVIGLLIHRHHRPRAFLDRPFALFLRRFSTFSDRAVIALILQQAANKVPIVFLTPTFSQPRDWDPYLVGFAGLKLWHPWRSAPIITRTRDAAWQDAADELIRRAHTILLDISDTSSALRTETEMLDKTGRWSDTVCLRLLVPNPGSGGNFSGVRTIDYKKSWVRALPRMVIGLLLVFLAAFSAIPAVLAFSVSAPILGWAAMVIAPAYYYAAFVRPSINRKAKVALKTILREVRKSVRAR